MERERPPQESTQNLSDFARHFAPESYLQQMPPSQAGPRCEEFASRLMASGEEDPFTADDSLASLFVWYLMRGIARNGIAATRSIRSRMIVGVEYLARRSYVAIVEDTRRTWGESNQEKESGVRVEVISPMKLFSGDANLQRAQDGADPNQDLLSVAALEIAQSWKDFPVLLMPPLPRGDTAARPVPGETVQIGISPHTSSASIGVLGLSNGNAIVTTAAHALGSSRSVDINGQNCKVTDIDHVVDTALIEASSISVSSAYVRGPLRSVAPIAGASYRFDATAGPIRDVVVAWDPSIPFFSPGLPIQAHVYTGCCTVGGDSGAALIDAKDRVVGFAQFAVPSGQQTGSVTSQYPGLSGWVWAESVFNRLSIS